MSLPRACGVLLHPTSLPGPHGSGDLGLSAYHFVDWLQSAGQSYWQILPLGGIGPGNSPYMSSSAFAGNVLLIDLQELQQRGWLEAEELTSEYGFDLRSIDFGNVIPFRMERLKRAASRFASHASKTQQSDYNRFCRRHGRRWLNDYALFMALSEHHSGRAWSDWEPALTNRRPTALKNATKQYRNEINFWKFCQWSFYRQWQALRHYANQRGVRIIGDMPIFIAHNSAEVWARQELFQLDESGQPEVVAGVPPDYFSETGQRWGNPLYRWTVHEEENFAWWVERVRASFELVDILRIDHFRGFAGYWEIPASEPTAVNGRWMPAPGEALFTALVEQLGALPIIAEDLGVITPDVEALCRHFNLPGMVVLQFAWGERGESRFLPHNHHHNSVVYTGTHDNDTSLGWWQSATEDERHHLREYLSSDGHAAHWDLIRCALASCANTAIFPLQDLLSLNGDHRMNFPGRAEGNWSWRLLWSDVPSELAEHLRHLNRLYERQPIPAEEKE